MYYSPFAIMRNARQGGDMATDRRQKGWTELLRIEAPHFVAGLEVNERMRVIRAAPILAWAMGRDFETVANTLNRKGWRMTDAWTYGPDGEPVIARGDRSHHVSFPPGPIRSRRW